MNLKTIDEDVFDLCARGNERAQLIIYRDYARAMYNVAFRILNDTAQAEDVMQESMIAGFNKIDQWNREATFGSWLKRIVINNALTIKRKQKRLHTVPIEDHHATSTPDVVYDENVNAWNPTVILEQINGLKDNYREVLVLSLIEGMDNEEISQIMNMSNGSCRTTISRAKEQLRNKLNAL